MDKFSALFAKGGLSLERLRTLCLVAEAGSLTAAAEGGATRVSQYSRQLRELESFFGTRLVRRRGNRIALLEDGVTLANLARRQFVELTDFATRCAGKLPEITLGAGASVLEWLLMPRLPRLRRTLRDTQLRLIRAGSPSLAARLRDLQLDVAILREDAVVASLETVAFAAYSFVLYVPRSLAGPARSLPSWLPDVPMILPSEGWTRDRVDAAAETAGLRLRIEIEGASATLAVRALREGHYAAILPEIAGSELAGADVIALRPSFLRGIERRLVIGWHPRQAESRPGILHAVDAIKKLVLPAKSGARSR